MAKKKTINTRESTVKYFSFPTSEKALTAYNQACRFIEEKCFMKPETLVSITDRVVTVPEWFPFKPKDATP